MDLKNNSFIKNNQDYIFEDLKDSPLLNMESLNLDRARKKYWKILQDTGDFISFSEEWEKIKEMSLDEIIESAEILKEHHYSAIGYDEYGYEKKAYNQYKKFLKKYSK